MAKLLTLRIDVKKIDKRSLFTGAKGTYLDVTVSLNDEKDTYGNDCSVWQGQTKEERESNSPRNFLGNGKILWESQGPTAPHPQAEDDDLPF